MATASRALIVAMSPDRVIGRDGKIPWHYPEDLKRFKRLTLGGTLIMGRKTFESVGRALPGRRNVVISRSDVRAEGVETFRSVSEALATCEGPVWFAGGREIYAEAMNLSDAIDVTYVPDKVPVEGSVTFPPIDPNLYEAGAIEIDEHDARLSHQRFTRRPT